MTEPARPGMRWQRKDLLGIRELSAEEIILLIQRLPPSYRMVFNLYAIEGYHHEEIANQLNITVGTSKSNLAIARNKLKKMLIGDREEKSKYHG